MTKTFNIHQAKTHLSRLIEAAVAGEEIVIAKAGKAKVRLVAVSEARSDRFGDLFGSLKHELAPLAEVMWFPTPEAELREMLDGHDDDPMRHLHDDLAVGGNAESFRGGGASDPGS